MKRLTETKANKKDKCIIIFLPIIIGLISSVVIKYLSDKGIFIIDEKDGMNLIESMVNIWGILFGFVITAISIFLTVGENSLFNLLVTINYMSNIILSYILAGIDLLLIIGFSIFVMITSIWNSILTSIYIGMIVLNLAAFLLCFYFLVLILLSQIKSS